MMEAGVSTAGGFPNCEALTTDERVRVAGIQVGNQASRQGCAVKIVAAVAARQNTSPVIIACTGATAGAGLDKALACANGAFPVDAEVRVAGAPQAMADVVAGPRRVRVFGLLNNVPDRQGLPIPLRENTLAPDDARQAFSSDPLRSEMLLEGFDEFGPAFRRAGSTPRPWTYPIATAAQIEA